MFGTPTENSTEEAIITEITDKLEEDATTSENEVAETLTVEKTVTSSDNITSFSLDVSDNPYILIPPPIQSPPQDSLTTSYSRWIQS